jgi:hypothetical protein
MRAESAHTLRSDGIEWGRAEQMSGPTDSGQLSAGEKIRQGRHSRLVKNFQISKTMRPFVSRIRLRLEDIDWTDRAIAAQFKRNCEEMKGILARKNIPEADADRASGVTDLRPDLPSFHRLLQGTPALVPLPIPAQTPPSAHLPDGKATAGRRATPGGVPV